MARKELSEDRKTAQAAQAAWRATVLQDLDGALASRDEAIAWMKDPVIQAAVRAIQVRIGVQPHGALNRPTLLAMTRLYGLLFCMA